jgi:hypothetical protein
MFPPFQFQPLTKSLFKPSVNLQESSMWEDGGDRELGGARELPGVGAALCVGSSRGCPSVWPSSSMLTSPFWRHHRRPFFSQRGFRECALGALVNALSAGSSRMWISPSRARFPTTNTLLRKTLFEIYARRTIAGRIGGTHGLHPSPNSILLCIGVHTANSCAR